MKRSGFPGEILEVVPKPRLRQAARHPVLARLRVTDVGYFPEAREHGRSRPHGASQAIIIICSHGRGRAGVGTTTVELGPGDALVIPERAAHWYSAAPGDPWSIWWLHVTGSATADLLAATGIEADHPVVRTARLELAVDLVKQVIDLISVDDTDTSMIAAAGAAWHLLATLALPAEQDEGTVELAKAFIVEHLTDPLTVAEIAAHVHLSPSHLASIFKTATGASPIAYQSQLRMRQARLLLDSTSRPVSEIAATVGYPDVAYFSRRFRQLHDQSPRQYRALPKG